MQQYFDGQVVLNRNEDHEKMARFLKVSGAIGNNITPGLKLTFDGDTRDMVDEIAGVENINSSVMFVS